MSSMFQRLSFIFYNFKIENCQAISSLTDITAFLSKYRSTALPKAMPFGLFQG